MKFYEAVDEMQQDWDEYLKHYNQERPHQGRNMKGKMPATVFVEGLKKKPKSGGIAA